MDNTKKRVLAAAADIFVQNGFSGSSISQIAKKAGINQSLIYHHVGNKHELWKEVKRSLLEDNTQDKGLTKEIDNFHDFLETIITQRIAIYEKDPRIARLIQWQMLEEDTEELIGGSQVAPTQWIEFIKILQNKNQVSKDYPPDLITIYIYNAVNGISCDAFNILSKDSDKKKIYINLVKNSLTTLFKNNYSRIRDL